MTKESQLNHEELLAALPAIAKLWPRPFAYLRKMRAAAGYKPAKGLTKAQCIIDILRNPEDAQATDMSPSLEEQLAAAQRTIAETELKLRAANSGVTGARADAAMFERRLRDTETMLSKERDKNEELIGTLRQLMHVA